MKTRATDRPRTARPAGVPAILAVALATALALTPTSELSAAFAPPMGTTFPSAVAHPAAPAAAELAEPATPQPRPAPQFDLRPDAAPRLAEFEDYRAAVGRLEDGELRVTLEAGVAEWRPWGDAGPALSANVFAADGAPPRIPGPLIRVTAGTPVHVTLRNTLGDSIMVRGLRDRSRTRPPGPPFGPLLSQEVTVPPGGAEEVRFTPTVPGTYFYFGSVLQPVEPGTARPVFSVTRGPFTGVLIVDPPGKTPDPDERIFLITHWADRALPGSWQNGIRFMINGRSWPHTERLRYAQGDTVRWRVINATGLFHPMHLHGFHFRVLARGDQWNETVFAPADRPVAVTENLDPGQAVRLEWVATEPGNWVYHCHLMRHMSWTQTAPLDPPAPLDPTAQPDPAAPLDPAAQPGPATPSDPPAPLDPAAQPGPATPSDPPAPLDPAAHSDPDSQPDPAAQPYEVRPAGHAADSGPGVDPLGGLVLGITIAPRPDHTPAAEPPRRRLRLHIGMRPGVFEDQPGYGFVLQDGDAPPAPDSVRFPGSAIVLTRGEPTEILVRNHADVPLGVHWHGLELESWADGVPGWSGMPGATVPAISPGDSLAVRMTPPRAGTFMYHVHSEPGHQLAGGLYGAFLVLPPGERHDPDTDRLFLLASLGAGDDPPPAVNGRLDPGPIQLRAGTTYRLRFMHISPDEEKRVRLLEGTEPMTWHRVAKDGADLPPPAITPEPADLRIHVGETYDFLWTPDRPGEYALRIVTTFPAGPPGFERPVPPRHTMEIPVRVTPSAPSAPPASLASPASPAPPASPASPAPPAPPAPSAATRATPTAHATPAAHPVARDRNTSDTARMPGPAAPRNYATRRTPGTSSNARSKLSTCRTPCRSITATCSASRADR